MGLPNKVSGFSQHVMFVLASNVDRVADTDHIDSIMDQRHDVIHIPESLTDRIALRCFHEMGL